MRESGNGIPFLKMHGAGNDFVVFDNRSGAVAFSEEERKAIADRRYGVGCDQIVLLETSAVADVFMRLYNADGGEVSACGNATRCVAWLLMEETGKQQIAIETKADVLQCERMGEMLVAVEMGRPRFEWSAIPLSKKTDVTNIPFIRLGMLAEGVAMSMGNPHIAFFVADVDSVPVETSGPKVEHHELFPERTNAEVAQVLSRTHLKVRVWERGAGETLACGTGACAAMVAARIRGFVDSKATVSLPGGDLIIEWAGDSIDSRDTVTMTGPVALVYEGLWGGR
jgi:diaminopimelate epimerase